MISTIIVVCLTVAVLAICRSLYGYPAWKMLLAYILIGAGVGALLDYVCGYHWDWYYYVHHTWFSDGYFGYVYPCWGMNLIITVCLYHIAQKNIKSIWRRMAVMLGLALFEEVMGIMRNSWMYEINPVLITLAWIGFIIVNIWIKSTVDWAFKRRVKVENLSCSLESGH